MEILEKILSTSAELFAQYGFKTITMDDISRRAGISKKTLYQHYSNKEEVVNESIAWYKNQMTAQCHGILGGAANAVEAMVKIIAFFDANHRNINPTAMIELNKFYPDAFRTFRKLIEEDVEMMKANIEQGIQEGYYRPELDADLMARYRMETSLLVFQPNLMVNDRAKFIQVLMDVNEHFMYGLMTVRGIELYKEYKTKYINTKIAI